MPEPAGRDGGNEGGVEDSCTPLDTVPATTPVVNMPDTLPTQVLGPVRTDLGAVRLPRRRTSSFAGERERQGHTFGYLRFLDWSAFFSLQFLQNLTFDQKSLLAMASHTASCTRASNIAQVHPSYALLHEGGTCQFAHPKANEV